MADIREEAQHRPEKATTSDDQPIDGVAREEVTDDVISHDDDAAAKKPSLDESDQPMVDVDSRDQAQHRPGDDRPMVDSREEAQHRRGPDESPMSDDPSLDGVAQEEKDGCVTSDEDATAAAAKTPYFDGIEQPTVTSREQGHHAPGDEQRMVDSREEPLHCPEKPRTTADDKPFDCVAQREVKDDVITHNATAAKRPCFCDSDQSLVDVGSQEHTHHRLGDDQPMVDIREEAQHRPDKPTTPDDQPINGVAREMANTGDEIIHDDAGAKKPCLDDSDQAMVGSLEVPGPEIPTTSKDQSSEDVPRGEEVMHGVVIPDDDEKRPLALLNRNQQQMEAMRERVDAVVKHGHVTAGGAGDAGKPKLNGEHHHYYQNGAGIGQADDDLLDKDGDISLLVLDSE